MRVLVCGGRTYDNRALVYETLNKLKPDEIVNGGAGTFDMFTRAKRDGFKVIFPDKDGA